MNGGDGWDKIFFVAEFVSLEVDDDDVDFYSGGFEFKKYFDFQRYGVKLGFASFYWRCGTK